ncbi:hypothetical protein KC343_g10349 [Hortaea werneckii]|uniref:Wax synthase domain-containing protein n=1 Tax=Hortaea werneckii TaxID=91943 RepID=A0A3M7GLQ4_HORWE|nr:hypothetical protein KC352_g29908 [Hortaea werneckii]KAI7569169.1 hypothetical protein KC317_g3557 [Hortaea werneckii]KAI7609027.1 hypothetical protein KC346_g9364 [Hortaea werneckii]KAI7614838.1 hypothetical protein KC343_g10349 [Hortaea werneckii]KAI7659215.1 hypothetical protein KC319_g9023 [Hortaea werneckii]
MGGVDVISVDVLLWSLLLLVLQDPWKDFRWIVCRDNGPDSKRSGDQGSTPIPAKTLPDVPKTRNETSTSERTTLLEPPNSDGVTKAENKPHSHVQQTVSEQPYPDSFSHRLQWVGTLLVSIRLNNWKISSPSHDRTQPPTPAFQNRLSFVLYTIFCFMRGYLVLDLTRAYIWYDAYFTDPQISIRSPLPSGGVEGFAAQFVRAMVTGAQAWALISQMFYLPCLLPVGLHALGLLSDEWSPHLWPSYFGSPVAIFLYGVRGFWGTYWHQTMRWSVAGPGYAVADGSGLKAGGLIRYSLITVVAFGLSGTVHMGLVPPQPLHATVGANLIRLYVAGFFWVQPMAMLVETLGAKMMKSVTGLSFWQEGAGRLARLLVNGVWVSMWFTLTVPLLSEAGKQMGYWRFWTVPISIWQGLRGEGWVAWPVLDT